MIELLPGRPGARHGSRQLIRKSSDREEGS